MTLMRFVLCGVAAFSLSGIAAANNEDDGFVWIDANTRIKVKTVSTTAGSGPSAPEKAPKKEEKKEKRAK